MNTAVSYKWLLSIVGPLAAATATLALWVMGAMIEPIKAKTQTNAARIGRQEERTQKQLDRIERKVDRLLEPRDRE